MLLKQIKGKFLQPRKLEFIIITDISHLLIRSKNLLNKILTNFLN